MLSELKQKGMEDIPSHPVSLLPKNFNYYAGGHVHIVAQREEEGYGVLTYPGPLFPNSFSELEELKKGGFYIVEDSNIEWIPIQIHNVFSLTIDCKHKTPEQVERDIEEQTKDQQFNNTIITLRLRGILSSGKHSDMNFRDIFQKLLSKSAYFVMKNTTKLESKEFDEIKIHADSVDEVEDKLIKEHLGQKPIDNEEKLTKDLITQLSTERKDGETVVDFEKRIRDETEKLLFE